MLDDLLRAHPKHEGNDDVRTECGRLESGRIAFTLEDPVVNAPDHDGERHIVDPANLILDRSVIEVHAPRAARSMS